MDRAKRVRGLILLLDSDPLFTVDEFLDLVRDHVDVLIKHRRLEERHRSREVANLMAYWHREPFVTPADVVSIKRSS